MSPTARRSLDPTAPSWFPTSQLRPRFSAPALTVPLPFKEQLALVDYIRLRFCGRDPRFTLPPPSPYYAPFRKIEPSNTPVSDPLSIDDPFQGQLWQIRDAWANRSSNRTLETPGVLGRARLSEAPRVPEPGRGTALRARSSTIVRAPGITDDTKTPGKETESAEDHRDPLEVEIEQNPLLNCAPH